LFFLQGASAVIYKNEDIRKHQLFSYTAWPGGLFGSTSMAGTRSGKCWLIRDEVSFTYKF